MKVKSFFTAIVAISVNFLGTVAEKSRVYLSGFNY